jgi:DNA (cytosine-5)-methyltransferase 1
MTPCTFRAGALFSGIGGFCVGFARARIKTVWAIDNDEFANATYRMNVKDSHLIESDIRTVSARHLDPVDVLHAGFPCQSFSQAGIRRGFDDERGRLFFEIPRLIAEFKDRKPKVIVLENAPYLRYGEGGAWFLQIQKAIQKAGYWFRNSNCAELNAIEVTRLPQHRLRLYMVAFSTDYFPSGRFDFPGANGETSSLEEYVDFDGEQEDDYYLHEENRYHAMISEKESEGRCLYQLRKYLVRVKAGTCPTLTANMGLGGHNVPFVRDRKGLRKLTERECLLLQGFPRRYRFPAGVPRYRRYIQVGNAVTVPVAELVAREVAKKLQHQQ